MTLYSAAPNRSYRVRAITDGQGAETELRRIGEMGLFPGACIDLLGRVPCGGGSVIRLRGYTAVIHRNLARHIEVTPAPSVEETPATHIEGTHAPSTKETPATHIEDAPAPHIEGTPG